MWRNCYDCSIRRPWRHRATWTITGHPGSLDEYSSHPPGRVLVAPPPCNFSYQIILLLKHSIRQSILKVDKWPRGVLSISLYLTLIKTTISTPMKLYINYICGNVHYPVFFRFFMNFQQQFFFFSDCQKIAISVHCISLYIIYEIYRADIAISVGYIRPFILYMFYI